MGPITGSLVFSGRVTVSHKVACWNAASVTLKLPDNYLMLILNLCSCHRTCSTDIVTDTDSRTIIIIKIFKIDCMFYLVSN